VEKPDLSQGVFQWAWIHLLKATHSPIFWLAEVTTLPFGGIPAAALAPERWSTTEIALFAAGASSASAVTFASIVYVGLLVIAPYAQRNQLRKFLSPIDLDVQLLGSFGWVQGILKSWSGGQVRLFQIGDILLVNQDERKVNLRLSVRVTMPNGDVEVFYATSSCDRSLGEFVSHSGEVQHLPTEILLDPGDSARGHTEFIMDMQEMNSRYGEIGEGNETKLTELVVEDLLSGDTRVCCSVGS